VDLLAGCSAGKVKHRLASYYINVKNEVDEDFLSVTRIPTGSLITKRPSTQISTCSTVNLRKTLPTNRCTPH
jgi:hypothetical protein